MNNMCPSFRRYPGLVTNLFLRNIKGQNYVWFVALVSKQNIAVLSTTRFSESVARKKKGRGLRFFPTDALTEYKRMLAQDNLRHLSQRPLRGTNSSISETLKVSEDAWG